MRWRSSQGWRPQERWQRIINTITDPQKVVIRTWMFGDGEADGPPDIRAPRRFTWDTQNQIVMAEPFMSYVVHDAVAMAGLAGRLPELYRALEHLPDRRLRHHRRGLEARHARPRLELHAHQGYDLLHPGCHPG